MGDAIVMLTTASSKDEGAAIAKVLVEEQLAACVNLIEGVSSFYIFEGNFCEDSEVQLVIKTQKGNFDAIEQTIKQMHSYDLPEILALPVEAGSVDYMQWLLNSC